MELKYKIFYLLPILAIVLGYMVYSYWIPKVEYGSTVEFNKSFELKPRENVFLRGSELEVKFIGIPEDSRCPQGTRCVWEGQVKALLKVSRNSEEDQFNITKRPGEEKVERNFGNYTIILKEVSPYPTENMTVVNYKIKLKVIR